MRSFGQARSVMTRPLRVSVVLLMSRAVKPSAMRATSSDVKPREASNSHRHIRGVRTCQAAQPSLDRHPPRVDFDEGVKLSTRQLLCVLPTSRLDFETSRLDGDNSNGLVERSPRRVARSRDALRTALPLVWLTIAKIPRVSRQAGELTSTSRRCKILPKRYIAT